MKYLLTSKKISPLLVIIMTGTIGILLVIAGTAGFIVFQGRFLDRVEKQQQTYFNLVDFRDKVIDFGEKSRGKSGPEKAREKEVLQFMHDRLAVEIGDACPRQDELFPIPSNDNSELLSLQMQTAIDEVRAESRSAAEQLVFFNQIFLFIILGLLLSLNIGAGWLLHYNYRLTLIPLAQLAQRLKRINRDIPESIHDTAEEMKKELNETMHSPDITQITQSIMSFCGDIEAKNKKLDEIFITDEKTGLFNYRHFKEHLIIDVERAKRFRTSVTIAMIDIDHFKRYNDANGHIAGDRVLEILAGIIRKQSRSSDIPSRFGGEEFAILFPNTDTHTAREISDRLRKIISAEPFPHEDDQPTGELTVSIGIATFPDDAPDWYTLINNADRALYEAKAKGRNNVVAFHELGAKLSPLQ